MSTIWHQSGVNKNGEGFVQLGKDDGTMIAQFSPQEARDHAMAMLEAAEAAEQDAFIYDFFTNKVGSEPYVAFGLIRDFRAYREQHGKTGPPSDVKNFIRTDQHDKP